MSSRLDFVQRANAPYIEEQYARYLSDPRSVPEEWALFFAGFELAGRTGAPAGVVGGMATAGPAAGSDAEATLAPNTGLFGLIQHYRVFGHLAARLDPLNEAPAPPDLLEPQLMGFAEADLDRTVDPRPFWKGGFAGTLRDLLSAMRRTYCGTLGAEYMYILEEERRAWLQEQMEPGCNHPALEPAERVRILRQLMEADAFEEFLQARYVGQKRFSLEGAATLIPMLDVMIEGAGALGVEEIVIGMPHRGRLNVLANIMRKPLEAIFSEFEASFAPEDSYGHGDVKYHLGYASRHPTRAGGALHLDLRFNPSHLEFVNPVVMGSLHARQDMSDDRGRQRGIPVLIHGDAAFAGEGIVPETLMMGQLPVYATGGTLHIIVNNQIGFTTSPADVRVSRYPTDIARAVDAPVFHVNGDDPEAAVHAMRVALAYRAAFGRDAFVDLVCYRRYGHNEMDDPTFTQPVMYRTIAGHTTAARRYAASLVAEGVLTEAELRAIESEIAAGLQAAHRRARAEPPPEGPQPLRGVWAGLGWAGDDWSADTAVPRETLERVLMGAARLPEGFHPHRKIVKLLADRDEMFHQDRIDWGLGETLAYGSLLLEGRSVRLSGQDTSRGTFSHRHAALFDSENGTRHVPLQHLDPTPRGTAGGGQGAFTLIDTPLNEAACVGFEYGYSTADPYALVVWEAQFGDFANVAQVYIDQFLASGESKWQRMSGLVLLLPHGYEGQGPEHSSARLERFLELCANGNLQVCNLTTPAQLFHALRRQLHRTFRKPLVIMSPKSLLRHKRAVSAVSEFTDGGFRNVIDDPGVGDPLDVRRVLLVSGKFYYTLLEAREARAITGAALVRPEQLYPFPRAELAELFKRYPNARDIRWVQEEPANMGAWRCVRHRIESILPDGATLRLVARKASPTPATGFYARHVAQEQALVDRALVDVGQLPARPAAAERGAPRQREGRLER
jgi:2-oxoglutarate dehydrogenase E1 component